MRFGLFRRTRSESKPEAEAIARVKAWVAVAGLPADASLAVNEIVCTDPSCPGTETIVLVMRPGRKTEARKVSKPVEAVTEADLREALAADIPL
ncbi:MAG TPA: hypothetical protein VKA80_05295 [Beijerinckiaceae bacterium]|nr:hypothetical protein [Beijerinckiaceae bacterium]